MFWSYRRDNTQISWSLNLDEKSLKVILIKSYPYQEIVRKNKPTILKWIQQFQKWSKQRIKDVIYVHLVKLTTHLSDNFHFFMCTVFKSHNSGMYMSLKKETNNTFFFVEKQFRKISELSCIDMFLNYIYWLLGRHTIHESDNKAFRILSFQFVQSTGGGGTQNIYFNYQLLCIYLYLSCILSNLYKEEIKYNGLIWFVSILICINLYGTYKDSILMWTKQKDKLK